MEDKESLLFRLMDRGARISKVNLEERTPLIKKRLLSETLNFRCMQSFSISSFYPSPLKFNTKMYFYA